MYYSSMIKNAPFRFADFQSIELTYGTPGEMLNTYNSATSEYQYVTNDNRVLTAKVKLRKDDLLYLHRKAMELGFWNVDDDMTSTHEDENQGKQVPRYILKYTYKEKSKQVTLDADFKGPEKMRDAAKSTIDAVITMIAEAQAR